MGIRVLVKLLDVVGGMITMIPSILAVGGFLASRLHPARQMELQWLGLFLPLILGVNILLIFYWVARKKWWFVIPLFAVLLNIPYLSAVFQWPFKRIEPAGRELKVATYNIRQGGIGEISVVSRELSAFMVDEKVDILCLQEFPSAGEAQSKWIEELSGFLPYYVADASSLPAMQVALFSRYPILQSQRITFPDESSNRAMWAELDIDGQVVKVYNVHLQTTNLNQNRIRPSDDIDRATSRIIRLKDMMDVNGVIRARQADMIREMIDGSTSPVILCGDFNDTPASYAYRRIKGGMEDSFRSCGKGYGYTYRYLKKLFRIDYIFYSGEVFRGTRYYSPELEYSDHKPVIVTLDVDLTPLSSRGRN